MKKAIAIEFLWFVAAAILAIPFGFAFLWLLNLSSGNTGLTEEEQTFMMQLYAIGYIASFIGIYIVRFIILSLKTLAGGGE